MKSIRYILLSLSVCGLIACNEPFEENWDLAIDYETINMSFSKTSMPITVYCSSSWTATLTEGSSWARLDATSGKGVSTIHFLCEPNEGLTRVAVVHLTGNGLSKDITITQTAGINDPVFILKDRHMTYPSIAYRSCTAILSNLPDKLLSELGYEVHYDGEEGWISDVLLSAESQPLPEEYEIKDGTSRVVNFKMSANTSGKQRKASIVFFISSIKDSVVVTQSGEDMYLRLPSNEQIPQDGGKRQLDRETNLGIALADAVFDIKYEVGNDFISESYISSGKFVYTALPNDTDERRVAVISITYTDMDGNATIASTRIEQKKAARPRQVSFESIRSIFAVEAGVYTDDEENEDYIEGIVIGDEANPNMEHNLNYGTTIDGLNADRDNSGANTIYTTENERTNYVESLDGNYGFRLKFADAETNTLHRGDKVRIFMGGVKVIPESAPVRYTLANLSKITVEESGVSLPVKPRTISSLTDEDVYTWCSLSDMEFQIKRGGYTNVREYDAILNPVNASLKVGTSQSRHAKDGVASLMYDKDNNAIYMLMNMNCEWRWDASALRKKQVPQGVGILSGIIVHQEMERWGGNIGKYSIRPFDESDIKIEQAAGSLWNDLVEWTFNKNTWSVKQYSWNANTSAIGGYYSTATKDQYYQEMLNATESGGMTNNTGDVARLYTENLKFPQGITSESYPVQPAWGYRGLSVSDPNTTSITNNVEQNFGMSAGSVIEFLCNYSSFYEWDQSGNWTGETNGIVAEFSTLQASGSEVSISFSIAGGVLKRSNTDNVSWSFTSSFPVDWAVEYAVSDNGNDFTPWIKAENAATGMTQFELRSIPFCVNNASMLGSYHSAGLSPEYYTQSDWGFGLVPYRFVLPSSILGKVKVRIRLVPVSTRMAEWNSGSDAWYRGQTYRGNRIVQAFDSTRELSGAICLEDILVQYK